MSAPFPRLDILLVDDSEDDVLMAQKVFARLPFPHELHPVSDASEALDYLRRAGRHAGRKSAQPDIILLDINMPGMNGLALLKELKADAALSKIPVVMLTTSSAHADISSSFENGAVSYITKPHNLEAYQNIMTEFGRYWLTVSNLPQ